MADDLARLRKLADDIHDAGRNYEIERLQQLAGEYRDVLEETTEPLDEETYRDTLDGLRRARAFNELARVAELLTRLGRGTPFVRNQHAHALIELRQVTVAIRLLDAIVADTAGAPGERDRLEAFGLLGRAYKQLYIDEKRQPPTTWAAGMLAKSINSYALGVRDNPSDASSWHAINIAALAQRAERDGIALTPPIDYRAIAQDLIDRLTPSAMHPATTEYEAWLPGVIAAAHLTLQDLEKAAHWFGIYTRRTPQMMDAFKVIGTIRQLEEVYGIKPGDPNGGAILASLKATALRYGGGTGHATFDLADAKALQQIDKDDPRLEAVLGTRAPAEITWLKTGLGRARSVATILRKRSGKPHGTGFLVRGGDIHAPLGDELMLLTNFHVISDPPHRIAIRPEEAAIVFDEEDMSIRYFCKQIVWSSPVDDLDACLLRLDGKVERVPPLPIAPDDVLPEFLRDEGDRRNAYVIGRPEGQQLSISLHDSELIDFGYKHASRKEFSYLHYKTPTKPGNSGSPVFEHDKWEVIGLHHSGPPGAGGSRKLAGKEGFNPPANEGIALRSIRAQIARDLGKTA